MNEVSSTSDDFTPTTGQHTLTPDELDYMRTELAAEFPHLSVAVEVREGTLYVEAVPA